jgi:hypothetical protein
LPIQSPRFVAAGLSLLLAACARVPGRSSKKFEVEDGDYGLIAGAALKLIERVRPISVIVVDKNTDPRARAALRGRRKVISSESLPHTPGYLVPPDYFLLRDFTIEDGQAMFEGEVSTEAQRSDTSINKECGLIFSVRFALQGDDWSSDSYKLTDCSQERVWWPKDP